MQHKIVVIIIPLILHTVSMAQMLSTEGKSVA